jgi:hypothetical protein
MRVRATRLSATGGNASALRPLTIGQLLPAGAGRVAAIYTDPAKPSWSEVIEQNRKALGPELAVNPTLPPTVTQNGEWLVFTNVPGSTLVMFEVGTVPDAGGAWLVDLDVQQVTVGGVRTVIYGPGELPVRAYVGTYRTQNGRYFESPARLTGSGSGTSNRITLQSAAGSLSSLRVRVSVRQIADWSQLVLFNDSMGVDPVFDPREAKGLGLLLDRSFGLERGPELVTNGSFDTATGWVIPPAGTLGTIAGGTLSFARPADSSSNTGAAFGPAAAVVGRTYHVRFDVVSGSGNILVNEVASVPATSGPKSVYITAVNTTAFSVRGFAGMSATIDNVSVREIPGNHRQQPTAAARGEFSARYNLLASSQCLGATWGAIGSGTKTDISANVLGGAITGGVRQASNGADWHRLENLTSVTLTAGMSYRLRFYMAPGTSGLYRCTIRNSSSAETMVRGPFAGAPVTSSSAGPAVDVSVVQVEPDLWVATFDFVPSTTGAHTFSIGPWSNTTGLDIIAYGGDIRLTADAIPSLPEYQAVRSPTDYDTEGFPVYHRSLTDDWSFFDIDPNGASQAYIFWAGRKRVDITAIIMESSVNSTTGVGAFAVVQLANGVVARSGGSIPGPSATVPNTAPNRLAFSKRASISEDILDVYSGKTRVSQNSADQGSGAYQPYRVFCGARGGTALFQATETFAPETVLLMQTGDDLGSAFARLQDGYAKAAGVQP